MPELKELRGIVIDSPQRNTRVTLFIRGERGDDYTTLVFPNTLPLNRGQIRVFIGNHFGMEPGHIKWPPHVNIPGE